jgi:very-short-patch-repair endonuclease
MTQVFNQKWSKERRRELRNKPTPAERLLWFYLKGKQVVGATFRRQYNIGRYIVDFYVPRLRLVVEVDGKYHESPEVQLYDRERTAYFTELGLQTLRCTNDEVFTDIDQVLTRIRSAIVSRASAPPLLKRGLGGVEAYSQGG